jgi:hypothetical protein
MPQVRSESTGVQPFLNSTQTDGVPPESSNKENATPADLETPSHRARPGSPSNERVPDSQPQSSGASTDSLPPQLALLLNAIRSSIKSFFTEKPPHTIQRLAELVLYPTKHYKTLPAYLRAVDRVTSVTSSADIFPFQTPAAEFAQSNGLAHPENSSGVYIAPDYAQGLGSDESLGGALLTPIPWLSNASFDGEDANGDTNVLGEGMVTTSNMIPFSLTYYSVTEEALPLQLEEETNATNIIPTETEDRAPTASPEPSDEVPHARGPILLGVEDMGLQDGRGIEMSLGIDNVPDASAATATSATEELAKTDSTPDEDGDIVLGDTKPKEEDANKEETIVKPQVENVESDLTGETSQAPDAEKKA